MNEPNEDPAARASRYVTTLKATLQSAKARTVDSSVRAVNILNVLDATQRYLQDAQHYLQEGRGTTALASVAYAEGLLDALFFLELA